VRYSVAFEGPAQALVHALKYGSRTAVAGELAALALPAAVSLLRDGVDALVPVPLHRVRRRERGFDQAELVSRALSSLTGVRTDTRCLRRVRATRSQTALPREGRIENVLGAFEGLPGACEAKRFLLVDDVVTTGATLRAASSAVEDAGAASVVCLAVSAREPVEGRGRPPGGRQRPEAPESG
jgi:ComF family protein